MPGMDIFGRGRVWNITHDLLRPYDEDRDVRPTPTVALLVFIIRVFTSEPLLVACLDALERLSKLCADDRGDHLSCRPAFRGRIAFPTFSGYN